MMLKLYFSDTVLEQIRKATNKGMIVGNDRFREEIEALRPMVKITSATDAPNFKSVSATEKSAGTGRRGLGGCLPALLGRRL
ncbi:hypothetical protein [Desulfobacter sp.]